MSSTTTRTTKNDIQFLVAVSGFIGMLFSLSQLNAVLNGAWSVFNFLPNMGAIVVWLFALGVSAVIMLAAIDEQYAMRVVSGMFQIVLQFLRALLKQE